MSRVLDNAPTVGGQISVVALSVTISVVIVVVITAVNIVVIVVVLRRRRSRSTRFFRITAYYLTLCFPFHRTCQYA